MHLVNLSSCEPHFQLLNSRMCLMATVYSRACPEAGPSSPHLLQPVSVFSLLVVSFYDEKVFTSTWSHLINLF